MRNTDKKLIHILAAASAVLIVPAQSLASDDLQAELSLSGTTISFALPSGYFNATLSVTGPDGLVLSTIAKSGSPTIDIGGQNAMGDGIYTYQLTAASPATKSVKVTDDNGRDTVGKLNMRGEMTIHIGGQASGTFVVKGGRIIDMSDIKEDAK